MAESLQSKDHKDLLDVIDKLRSRGISRYIDLPQIIVCGDQSSGKSSAMEAISGLSFPTKDILCTRFATEVILRRSTTSIIRVSIFPSYDRPDAEKATLSNFAYTGNDVDIGQIVEDAGLAMGLQGNGGKVFSKDVLRIEISGPTQPHLTMVDLPGLFLAGNKDQSAADSAIVKSLVLDYMKRPRSIILAVVSAKSDFALQQVTEHTREIDPKGRRTLGLITKPDTLDKGSDSEQFYVNLAENKDVHFRLGWHVLRNRDFTMRHATATERDAKEAEFFSEGVWATLKMSQLGVTTLRIRLSEVLRDQILSQLPSVLDDIQCGLDDCRFQLESLGSSRITLPEKRRYLLKASEAFNNLVKAAINGEYTDPFFGDSSTEGGYSKRLRAVVQKHLCDFADEMHKNGQTKQIVEHYCVAPGNILRSDYMQEVKELMERSRGRELPGTFNPLVVSEMFSKQCAPWKLIASDASNHAAYFAETTVNLILQHVVDETTASALLHAVVRPALSTIKFALKEKVIELLDPYLRTHPITYNHYLTDNIQKSHFDRQQQALEKQLLNFFGIESLTNREAKYSFNPKALLNAIGNEIEPNMGHYACSLAIDTMQAYYKVLNRLSHQATLINWARLHSKSLSMTSPSWLLSNPFFKSFPLYLTLRWFSI